MSDLKQDIGYAVRALRKAPAFTITAVLALSLGIGANTAIFSLVRGILLRPLPFPHPEQLIAAWSVNREAGNTRSPVSPMDLADWRSQARVVSDLGGYFFLEGATGIDLTGSGEPQRLSVAFVTPGFFSTLGVNAELGRVPGNDQLDYGGDNRVVVFSHGLWQRQFGASRAVIGSTVTLNRQPFQVAGVMPADFRFPSERVDAYVPYSTIPESSIPRVRGARLLGVVGRLAPGRAQAEAENELNTIARRLGDQYPENASWASATVGTLQSAMTGPVQAGLLVLWGAVAFVLLMACVNVSGLLLARSAMREREMAIRASLGGTRGRIVRQLLTESIVLAVGGGILGLLLATGALKVLLALSAGQLPRAAEVRLDAGVLTFAAVLSLITGVVFGLLPALRASAPNLQRALREGGRGLVAGVRLRNGLVVAEVALAVLLVTGSGLMIKSFRRLLQIDPGFRPEQLVAVRFTISTARHPSGQYPLYYHELIDRVRELPGVISAAAVKDPPFQGAGENWPFVPEGTVLGTGQQPPTATVMHVSDGYFKTIGARVTRGREFTPQDRPDGPFVIVVNEALAKRFFPAQDPLGRTLAFSGGVPEGTRGVIIGVVADIRQTAVEEAATPAVYVDNMLSSRVRTTIVVRTAADLLPLARRVRDVIWSVDKDQTITSIFTFEDIIADAVARPRLLTAVLGAFGALALGLGSLGIYGLLAYVVGQRQREIGVRLALGARSEDVLRMFVARGLVLAGIGILIGIPAALYLAAFLRDVLFEVRPADPVTYVAVTLALLLVAALASYLPARRAAHVDPAVTLREE
ncbi:MAG: ABC transporter permease [Gemmatimonadetes bacterium]|nr:ABC transporter permease [Gemmatimonadota bacterium]